jgi:hypothetical protein
VFVINRLADVRNRPTGRCSQSTDWPMFAIGRLADVRNRPTGRCSQSADWPMFAIGRLADAFIAVRGDA